MKQGLGLRFGQSLTMTPALQQAIRLLQLSTLDLQQEIQQAVDSNVMLELTDEAEGDADDGMLGEWDSANPIQADAEPAAEAQGLSDLRMTADDLGSAEHEEDIDWGDRFDTGGSGDGSRDPDELDDFKRANISENETLQEHLHWQLRLASFQEWERVIAEHIVDAINEDGYLQNWEEICLHFRETMGLPPYRIEAVLRVIQEFDPPGIAARDLSECLSLQLRQFDPGIPGTADALLLVGKHLPLVARRDLPALRRATGLDESRLSTALRVLRALQPHPGRPYAAHESNYVEPDVRVTKHAGHWKVSLNRGSTPSVRINPQYLALVKRADSSPDQVTLKNHLQEARYFLHSLQSRNETLLRVAQCIVEEQRAFLDYGPEAMRPLVLRDVAGQLGIHESTVSRATANKYLLTPTGLYELKHFFSSHVPTVAGGVASATAIQAMLKRLIGAESPANPLSDQTLAELLQGEGMQVARRTIAKYRESLNIPPSHERKQN